MSLGDFHYLRGPYTVQRFDVKAGAAESIKAGEPVVQNTGGDDNYVVAGSSEIVNTQTFVGIAESSSTDTASADGVVYVILPSAGTVFRGRATTPANLAAAVKLTYVEMDETGTDWTIDENDTTAGFCKVIDYNATAGTVDFSIAVNDLLNGTSA